MKTIQFDQYGDAEVLKFRETDLPYLTEDMLLIKVHASSVNPVEYKIRSGELKFIAGFRFPKTLGSDFAGEVVYAGKNLTGYQAYDKVYGMLPALPGGAYADYVSAKPDHVAAKPTTHSYEEAAGIPLAGLTALQGLRDEGEIRQGQRVLINGASGGVGTYGIQIAKAYDTEVTAVCSTRHVDLVRDLGADDVINYEREDLLYTRKTYDLIFDVAGTLAYADAKHLLRPQGIFVTSQPGALMLAQSLYTRAVESRKLRIVLVRPDHLDLHFLKGLAESGRLRTIVDSVYPLEEVARAHAHAEEGHLQGKVILSATPFSTEK